MAPEKLQVGNVEILDLTDAAAPFFRPLTEVFPGVTAEQWAPYRERYPSAFAADGSWHAHFGSFLVRSQGRTLLIDTGIGPMLAPRFGGKAHLLEELSASGVATEDIDTVFITHAHPDHVGWNMTAEGKPTFPRAHYMLHQADWDALPQLLAEGLSLWG